MTSSEQINPTPGPYEQGSSTSNRSTIDTQTAADSSLTRAQADQIISELKSIKQNIFWLLLVAGFFVARSFFFHY